MSKHIRKTDLTGGDGGDAEQRGGAGVLPEAGEGDLCTLIRITGV
jgi:hypothetical protein